MAGAKKKTICFWRDENSNFMVSKLKKFDILKYGWTKYG